MGDLSTSKYTDVDYRALALRTEHTRKVLEVLWQLSKSQIDGLLSRELTPQLKDLFYLVKPDSLRRYEKELELGVIITGVDYEDLRNALPNKLLTRLDKARIRTYRKTRVKVEKIPVMDIRSRLINHLGQLI